MAMPNHSADVSSQSLHLTGGAAADGSPSLQAWRDATAQGGIAHAAAQARGDFAVGFTDAQGRSFLAVDRFARQTLCYRVEGGQLRFAAKADALRDGGDADIEPQALFDYLYFHAIPSPRTVFRGVHRLPPGHCATFENGRLSVVPYWTPTFAPATAPSFDTLRDEFMALLRQAVAHQLDGSRPACFLSGGTDSSTVAGLLAEVSGQAPVTYSIGFDATGYDEMAYARIAAKRYATEHREYYVTAADLVDNIGKVAASYDQPFGNSSALPAYSCALMARQDGITRLLAGDGGDELFGGNSRYALQGIFDLYERVPSVLRSGLLEPIFLSPLVSRTPLIKKGSGYIRQAKVPMPDRLQLHNLLGRLGYSAVLTPEFLARVKPDDVLQQQRTVWSAAQAENQLDRNLAFDWRYTLAESDLPKVRGTTQLAGVSVGYPLLDDALLAFSMRLPLDYKLRGTQLRWFFKEALRGFLPDEIITKRKHGFGLPFGVWASRDGALKNLAFESVQAIGARGIVQSKFIDQLLHQLLPTHPGYYGEMIWILMMLEQWLRAHSPNFRVRD